MYRRWVGWPSWLNLIAGIWLVIAPFALGYSTRTARGNDIVLGGAIILLAAWALVTFFPGPSWVNAAIGIWLIIDPFVLNYSGKGEIGAATNNDIGIGAAVMVLGLTAALTRATMASGRGGPPGSGGGPSDEDQPPVL